MSKIIVNFPSLNKQYLYSIDKQMVLKIGDKVLVDNNQIIELAEVYELVASDYSASEIEIGEGKILRKCSPADQAKLLELKEKAQGYLGECRKLIDKYQLSMKLVDADLSFDEKKLTFYFGAEGRVDFRPLVTDLIKKFKKLIRLQQIGARDETRILGGFGRCGRQLCCQGFLKKVDSVTLDMAKEQDLSGGIGKISGVCGKLMCCLAYELEEYRQLKAKLPEIGEFIKTKHGRGKVIEHHILRTAVTVELEKGGKVKLEI